MPTHITKLQTQFSSTVRQVSMLVFCVLFAFAVNASDLKSKGEYVIEPGESFYAVVANNYPGRMNRWTDVASDLVTLNPDLFPRGLDTPLQPGMVIKLVDYDSDASDTSSPASTTRPNPSDRATADTPSSGPDSLQPSSDNSATAEQDDVTRGAKPDPGNADGKAESASDNDSAIGRVTTLNGNAQATNYADEARVLKEGDAIYPQEIIHSGRNTEIALQMIDEAKYTIHSNSRFAFETYDFTGQTEFDRSVVTLSGGGFRVVAGKIGTGNTNAMSVNTPAATITVRDSDFALRICEQDACRFSVSGHELKNGLYAGLLQGSAILTNNAGPQRINAGEFFYTPSPDSSAVKAPESASLLFSVEELSALEISGEDDPKSFLGWLMNKVFGD